MGGSQAETFDASDRCLGRILTLCYEHPPLGGGGGNVASRLSERLASEGYAVDQITMQFEDSARSLKRGNLSVHQIVAGRRSAITCTASEMVPYVFRSAIRALRLAHQQSYDYNLSHFIFPDGLTCLLMKWLNGLPYVITAHGTDVPGYNPHRFILLHRLLAPFWRLIALRAAVIVCPSALVQRLVCDACPKARTVVIPNGIDPERFVSDRPKVDRILFVARMLERKGAQHAIEALAGLHHAFELHVVGDGPYLSTLRSLAAARPVKVVFHGALPSDSKKLRELYETSRIFVFTSEAENFPMVLLEAMAAGCAIVTSAGTGCAEVVGEAGLLVTPGDIPATRAALVQLMNDRAKSAAMGQQARRRVERHFAWDRVSKQYIGVLQGTRSQSEGLRTMIEADRSPSLTAR